jgi:hypothetical protein
MSEQRMTEENERQESSAGVVFLFHPISEAADALTAIPLPEAVTFSAPPRLLIRRTNTTWLGQSRAMKS